MTLSLMSLLAMVAKLDVWLTKRRGAPEVDAQGQGGFDEGE